MSAVNNRYDIYVDRTIQLAETICVHLPDVADAINQDLYLKTLQPVTSLDKTTWKYYQNICGQYYITDKVMYVTSLDTQEQIVFNIENLLIHVETCKAYQYNSRHYKDLVLTYPDQEMLILGILYPADMQTAINAKEGQILSYPGFMLDDNEYQLIPNLQKWIYNYIFRWINKQYTVTDNLYVASYISQLFLHMVPAIYNIRLAACHTNNANSYHVIEYLASHNYLNTDYDYMNDYQRMFFYRNIRVIERNAGMQSTFDWLVQNVMSERNLPLYEYNAKHSITANTGNDISNLLPTPYFSRNSISGFSDAGVNDYSLDHVLTNTDLLANENTLEHQYNEKQITDKLTLSKYDNMQTKILESSVTDYSQVAPVSLVSILLNHWAYLAFNGTYTAVIPVTMPNAEVVTMSAKNAFILYSYILHKLVGKDQDYPSTFACIRVVNNKNFDYSKIASITDTKYTDPVVAKYIVDLIPQITPMLSIDSFYNQCNSIYNAITQQYFLYNSYNNAIERGELKAVSYLPFADVVIDTGINSTNVLEWLGGLNLDLSIYTGDQLNTLMNNIAESALGLDLNVNITLQEIQTAMIDVFLKLSSYSIQIMSNKNKPDLTLIPCDFISVREIKNSIAEAITIDDDDLTIVSHSYKTARNIDLQLPELIKFSNLKNKERSIISMPIDNVAVSVPTNKLDYGTFSILLPIYDVSMTSAIINKPTN